jgi:hypothetical protein
LLAAGFHFELPDLEPALTHELKAHNAETG